MGKSVGDRGLAINDEIHQCPAYAENEFVRLLKCHSPALGTLTRIAVVAILLGRIPDAVFDVDVADGRFDGLWIQPAAGDAGGALGAALAVHHIHLGQARSTNGQDKMSGSYLGPAFAQSDIERRLTVAGAKFSVLADTELFQAGADALSDGKALGWFQGRMEFGPRETSRLSIM